MIKYIYMAVKHFNNMRSMNYTMHNDPVYETIQQKPDVFTEWRLSQATTNSGDQQMRDIPGADWKREHPHLEMDGTYITMNSVRTLSANTSGTK